MIEDINLITNYCHAEWSDRALGRVYRWLFHYGNSAMACKFHEYPKGLIHWKGEQLLDVIYSTQLFVLGNFIV